MPDDDPKLSFIDRCRIEGLRAAAQRRKNLDGAEAVINAAGMFSDWLLSRPASIRVRDPVVAPQADPEDVRPATRTGADMAVTMKDTDVATYPAPEALDSKGFEVDGDTITPAEDSAGAVVAMTVNADGSTVFAAVAPGAAQVSWTDGAGLTFADTINVTAGDAASLVVGAPVITSSVPGGTP